MNVSTRGNRFRGPAAALSAVVLLAACGTGSASPSASGATGPIGVSLITKTSTNPFFIAMANGAKESADKLGMTLTTAAGTALVFVDRPPNHLDADAVVAANRSGAAEGVRHLMSVGHRRICFLGDLVTIPLAGFIFASQPVLVGDTPQTASDEAIEITRDLVKDSGDLFALRVKGDSMIDAMVNDGDIVVMKKVDRARNGEMVAVWLNDRSETTLKHFYLENGRVRLQPANPTMQPIMIDDPSTVQVQGKVVLVVRQLN